MNTARNLVAYSAMSAIALLAAFASLPASAQELTRAEVRASVIAARADGSLPSVAESYGYDSTGKPLNGVSVASRADVKSATVAAIRSGEVDAMMGNSYGAPLPAGQSDLTRAQVRTATAADVRSGRIDAQLGEGYGSPVVAARTGRRAL